MFFWGMVSILQLCYIPGSLLVLAFLGQRKWYEMIPLAFGLSLLANYIVVFVLVLLKIYTRHVMIGIIAVELIVYFYMLYRKNNCATVPAYDSQKEKLVSIKLLENLHILLIVAICMTWVYVLQHAGDIFQGWDAVVSWNRWAVDWASNRIPNQMWHYPQLLPAGWSVSYVLMNDVHIQFFAVLTCLFFIPMAAHAFFVLYNKSNRIEAVIAALVFFAVAIGMELHKLIGFADFPVAVILVLALACLIIASNQGISEKESIRYVALGLILAGTTGVVKQAGIFGYITYIALMIGYWRDNYLPRNLLSRKMIILCFIGTIFLVFSWYMFVRWRIAIGIDSSEIGYVTDGIYKGRGYLDRIAQTLHRFPTPWVVTGLALPGLFLRRTKIITICGTIYSLLWGCFWSYDVRNFSVALPILAFAIAGWFSEMIKYFMANYSKIQSGCTSLRTGIINTNIISLIKKYNVLAYKKFYLTLLFLGLFMGTSYLLHATKFHDDRLRIRQHNKLMNLGNPEFNKAILNSFSVYGKGIVLSDYQYLEYIPDIGFKNFKLFHFSLFNGEERQEVIDGLVQELELILCDTNIKYILLPDYVIDIVNSILNEQGLNIKQIELNVNGWSYLMLP